MTLDVTTLPPLAHRLADAGPLNRLGHQQIPLAWAERQASAAVASGVSLDALYRRALIAPKFGDERDHISPLQLMVFYAALVLETDDATHAMVRRRQAPATGPLGFRILFGGPTLGDGLIALARFYQLSSPSIQLHLSTEGAQAFLAIRVEDDRGAGLAEEDIQLIYLYFGLCSFQGMPFPVSWVGTRDVEHFSLGSPHYFIGSPVRLHKVSGLSFPRGLLASRSPMRGVDDFGWWPIEESLDLMAPPVHPVLNAVNNQGLRLEHLAAEHGMAPSTYRRMAARNGAGFRQLRERALLDATLDLLKVPSCSIEDIAEDLGYSDGRSLRRFVKRATGRTPNELRQGFACGVPPERLRSRFKEIIGRMPL